MPARTITRASGAALFALPVIVAAAAVLAVSLHRQGHAQGDDFALYLRQARSIFDGDPSAVIADNRFAVVNSDNGFSPIGYPWGWPLVLAPFVRFWGFDYDRLKLVEVAALCLWLTLLHGVVRRRLGHVGALAVVAVFATSFAYLQHTEQLLTEIPHLATVTIFVWWYDKISAKATLLTARVPDLAILGVLAAASFNVRREGVALVAAAVAIQVIELVRTQMSGDDTELATDESRWRRPSDIVDLARRRSRTLATPLASFVSAVVGFQLLLPTALVPDNDNSRSYIIDRFGEYPAILAEHLGFGVHPAVGVVVFAIAVAGAVIGVRARPHLDGMLLLISVFSALTIGTHFREVDRYWFQVNPWVVYFVAVALISAARTVLRSRDRFVALVATAPIALLVVAHSVALPGHLSDVREFNESGQFLSGPTNPDVDPVYEAVRELTPPDGVVAFLRARTMTLLTDRRSFQTKRLDQITIGADYLAQRRRAAGWQPEFDEVVAAGYLEIWSDDVWILWEVPRTDAPLNDISNDEADEAP